MIVQKDGIWWPESDIHARYVITQDVFDAVKRMLTHVSGRDCIVQAGANVGVYPIALAGHFQKVITVEPDPENYLCLTRNLFDKDVMSRVTASQAAFGAAPGGCKVVEVTARNCGAHRIDDGGSIPVITIDSLGIEHCDAIWLDIEGSEYSALQGAVDTIDRFSPTIGIEDKGLHSVYGIPDGAIQDLLSGLGYEQVDRIGLDKIYRRN